MFSFEENKNEVDISSLSEGIYFISIRTKQGILVKKFVKF